MHFLALRFDIDTIRCARMGIPALLKLAREEGCRFTFFINMGHSVVRSLGLRRGHGNNKEIYKLGIWRKLRMRDFLTTLIMNPMVGAHATGHLRQIIAEDHELGLHGGLNHGLWQHSATAWNKQKVLAEVKAGLSLMAKAGVPIPHGFASPGFTHPPNLAEVLQELGFLYIADQHSTNAEALTDNPIYPIQVNTNILGMPGNVGYLEWSIAKKMSRKEMLEDFDKRARTYRTTIMYDHPSVAGFEGLERLRTLIRAAHDKNYSIVTIRELLNIKQHL